MTSCCTGVGWPICPTTCRPMQFEPQSASTARGMYAASLDHTIWFHRPVRVDEWHLHDFTCHSFGSGRGLAIGHVFAADGAHVATVAQEVLMRDRRNQQDDAHVP